MFESQPAQPLQGRRILVAEDDYIVAQDLREALEAQGADVLGPVPVMDEVLDLLAADPLPDAALLDINLGGDMAFPVADVLQERGVQLAFVTGYDAWAIPDAYAHIPRFDKPLEMRRVVSWLLG